MESYATPLTPPATPKAMKMLSVDAQSLLETTSLQETMGFIYDTGYSSCTQHCCQPRSAMPNYHEDGDCFPGQATNSVLASMAIDSGRTIETGTYSVRGLTMERGFIFGSFGKPARPLDPLDTGIRAAKSPKRIPRSAKLQQWDITPTLDDSSDPGTDSLRVAEYVSKFSEVKARVNSRYAKHMNPDTYIVSVASVGRVRPERDAFATKFSNQTSNKVLVQRIKDLRLQKNEIQKSFEGNILFCKRPLWLAYNVLWSQSMPGFDELSKAYLAWRKLWHVFVFCPRPLADLPRRLQNLEPEIRDVIPQLQMWGNVQNDYTLFHYQELTRKDLRYTYEHEPQSLRYMLENLSIWEDEIEVLNDYVGVRRNMPREYFHACKSAAQRTGSTMEVVARTALRLTIDPTAVIRTPEEILEIRTTLEDQIFTARQQFLELKGCLHGCFDIAPKRTGQRSRRVLQTSL